MKSDVGRKGFCLCFLISFPTLGGVINMLVLEIPPYDFLLDAAGLNNSQERDVTSIKCIKNLMVKETIFIVS
jgi:hypothetical protein